MLLRPCTAAVLFTACLAAVVHGVEPAAIQSPATPPPVDPARAALARSFSTLLRQAIPEVYDKQEDWGETKNVVVGLRTEGKGLKTRLKRRKKPVNHGVWKHYRIRLVEPEKNLVVRLDNLRAIDGGRAGFQLHIATSLDAWARAKVYQYGVHLIALEVVGKMRVELTFDCEVGLRLAQLKTGPGAVVEPVVKDAQLKLVDFEIERVSNAHGPLVGELSDAVKKHVERELTGEKLTAKLNRAIEKKQDRLQMSWSELLSSDWRPLASLPR